MPTKRISPGLALVLAAAQRIYPDFSVLALADKLRFVGSWLKYRSELNVFFHQSEHDALLRELAMCPEIMGFIIWPYIHARWSVMQRFEAIAQHHQALGSDLAALTISPVGSLIVADMSDVSPGLKLLIDRAPWFLREGGLVFNQFLNDERLMSLSFSFGWREGERVAYVGGLQGSNDKDALARYREIAKPLQGMRSRDFVIKSFQFLTYHLGVKGVLCVCDEQRHHRHPYFGPLKAKEIHHLNYNQVWQEHAGVRTADGFYRLGLLPVVKPMNDIAAKNRALYRRRYALLEKLSSDIALRFNTSN